MGVLKRDRIGRAGRRALRAGAVLAAAGLLAQGTAPASAKPWPARLAPARVRPAFPAKGSAAMAAWRRAHGLGAPPRFRKVPGRRAVLLGHRPAVRWRAARPVPPPAWPKAATTTVTVQAPGGPAGGGGQWLRAGGTSVAVSAPAGMAGVSRVRVTVAGHRASLAAGPDGMLVALARADGGTRPGQIRVRVSYAGFARAFGGGFGPSLELFAAPACALTTPRVAACRVMAPVRGVNDWGSRSVTATVTLPGSGSELVLALDPTTSSGTGDFKATPLTPSSSWQVGRQTGDFTWTYPLRVPPPIAGAAPSLALSYDSGTTDGETAFSNSQPGQLGEGFSLAGTGYIERKYVSCGDIIKGKVPGDTNNTTQTSATGDQCWDGYNAYLSLGGHSGQLVLDNSSGKWHLANDDGSTVKFMTDQTTNGAYHNSDWEIITPDGTQYWFGLNQLPGYGSGDAATNSVWTEPVGELSSGQSCFNSDYAKSYCPHMPWRWNLDLVVDPSGNATSYYYTKATNYYAYGSTGPGTGTPIAYDSGGTLDHIYYGSHVTPSATAGTAPGGDLYAHRPFKVAFGYSDRCTQYLTNDSNCQQNKTTTSGLWPDVPWYLYCAQASGCTGAGHGAPSFFDTQMLTSVTTSVYEGSSTYQQADDWTLRYVFQGSDVNDDLTITSIIREGDVGGSIKLNPVTFGWTSLNNRVNYDYPNYPMMGRYRLTDIISETGADTHVSYSNPTCNPSSPGTPPDPATNTWPCFQQKWNPGDQGGQDPVTTSWFNKYTVSQVTAKDLTYTGNEPPLVTQYVYCDTSNPGCTPQTATGAGGAWHYDTDVDLVGAKYKTYSQWRGYRYVHVITGATTGTQSETDYTFLRGMDGNPVKNPDGSWGSQSASVTPNDTAGTSQPSPVTDQNPLNGFQLEAISYNQPGGPQLSDQVNWPWLPPSPTAKSVGQPWGQPLTAWPAGTAETDTYTPLSAHANNGTAGTRQTQVTYGHDNSTGLITSSDDVGDVSLKGKAGDQQLCTTDSYSPSGAGLIAYPDEIKTTACGAAGSPLVSDTKYFYDGSTTWGTAPAAGNVTETDVYSSPDSTNSSAHWIPQSRLTYDSSGRVICSENASGSNATCIPAGHTTCTPDTYTTCTTYISAWGTGNPTTQVKVTSPLTASTTATTTTDLNAAWGQTTDTIDASNQRTDYAYDALGRVTRIWLPSEVSVDSTGKVTNSTTPNYTFSYNPSDIGPSSVITSELTYPAGAVYNTTVQLYDALLRLRQTQAPADDSTTTSGGTVVTDTFYDSRGNVVTSYGPYEANQAPSASLFLPTSQAAVPNVTTRTYDGAGRAQESDFTSQGTQEWKTTWSYPGADAVTVTPPAGASASTTYTDARGRTIEIDQYHAAAGSAYDATTYAYDLAGRLNGITDAGGNQWTYGYDLLGHQISATDPDTGTTTSAYDDLGQLTSVTDAAKHTISYAYDAAGRKTFEYDTTNGAPSRTDELAAWTYDTAALDNTQQAGVTTAIGQPATATAYVGGTTGEAYKAATSQYSWDYQPEAVTYTIPSNPATGALAGQYQFSYGYNAAGQLASQTYPLAGGLPAETVLNSYDPLGYFTGSGSTLSGYVAAVYQAPWGSPAEIDLATSSQSVNDVKYNYTYYLDTHRLSGTTISRESNGGAYDSHATYNYDPSGNLLSGDDSVTGDNQCYAYDYLARLVDAWSQATACPASPATPPGGSGIGGPAPYQLTLAYDTGGSANGSTNGTTGTLQTSTLITGPPGTGQTTTTTNWNYPTYGAAQPHAPAGTTAPAATTDTWTQDGRLAKITNGSGATTSSYNWDGTGAAPGQLSSATTSGTTTSYRYDAAGNLLLVNDGGTPTLYLPGEEITATGTGSTATYTATRYYTAGGGQVIAARTGTCNSTTTCSNPPPGSLNWLFTDPHGTPVANIDAATTSAVTWRHYTPSGQPRGTPPSPSAWPGTKGFVGGTTDTTTGLTNLGAREYNPTTPMFISADPIINPYQPVDLDPYDYANGNPATLSDPTGLCFACVWGFVHGIHAYEASHGGRMPDMSCDGVCQFFVGLWSTPVYAAAGIVKTGWDGGSCILGNGCHRVLNDINPWNTVTGIYHEFKHGQGALASGQIVGIAALLGLSRGAPAPEDTALTAAQNEAAALRAARAAGQWQGRLPTMTSAAVDRITGQVVGIGHSRDLADPPAGLEDVLPKPSLEGWPEWNCAEVAACGAALQRGSLLENLVVMTVRTATGNIWPACANCRLWLPGRGGG